MNITIFPDGRLDAKNAAKYLGLSEKTLAMMRCKGEGPKFIKRGRIFYFQEVLDRWIQGGEAQSTTEAAQKNKPSGFWD